ncbi:DinB family protein [Pedobacter faecalis]|uniref:DinB family protein n=1 Tax=Pedobacter faecalis TaxID=3041495 RepID=UPI00254BB1D1|nr:DinB family protein [Pedobacter sp. ELA7]
MMETLINVIKTTRENFIRVVESLSPEQLNHVPEGFNNNIIWNFAHIISAQQLLCYRLSGLEPRVDMETILAYRKGTKPEKVVDQEEISRFVALCRSTVDDLVTDLSSGMFVSYQQYTTEFGFELNSVHEAVQFFAVHDSMHLGYAMALRKAVLNNNN